MDEVRYASLDSQMNNEPSLCEDTEEMFWLRESDDYESQVRLGNLLSGQYRFREAVEAYLLAEKIRGDDPMLYIRLGGAYLTLRRFDEARKAYLRSNALGGSEKVIAYPMGVWHYLQGHYQEAAENFVRVLPCEEEMEIVVLYWNAICCMRGNRQDRLRKTYRDDMQVGHHTAYKLAVEVIFGKKDADEAQKQAQQDINDLNAVIAMYGIAIYLEYRGQTEAAEKIRTLLLRRESVWPCISYLAAWNDRYMLTRECIV